MGKNLVTEAERYLSFRHKDKRRSQVLRIAGLLVVFATVYALILPAVTMSNEVECGKVEHIHTESCWQEQLASPQPQLVCAAEPSGMLVLHMHDSYCYNDQGELICTLEEREAHTHGPECYQEQRTLLCGQVADPGHQHSASCYTYVRVESADAVDMGGYTCGFQEGEGAHRHTEECYPEERAAEPLCGLEETGDEYDEEGNLVRQGHVHTDKCWLVRVHEKLVCGQEESEDVVDEATGEVLVPGHHHTASCWLTGDELCCQYGCGQHESTGHVHTAACGQGGVQADSQGELWEQVLTCGEEEREPGHIHTDECYEIHQVLTCHKQELQPHTHDAGCYDESGALVCGKLEAVVHQHTAECFVTPEGGPEPVRVLICGMEEHVHTEYCYVKPAPKDDQVYYCGLQEHIHTMPDCYFESGELRCTLTEHVHDLTCLQPPAEASEEPVDSQEPAESAAPDQTAVELTNAEFSYSNEAFTMTFTVNGFAHMADGWMEPEQPVQSGGAFSDPAPVFSDPAPVPSGEVLIDITNQMVPLAAMPRMLSLTVRDSDALPITDEFSGATAPGSYTEPEAGAVEDSTQSSLDGQEPGVPESAELQPNPEPVQTWAGQVEFQAVKVPEDSEEYKSFAAYAEQLNGGNKPEAFELVTLAASVGGMELDLSNCYMTVEVAVNENALEGGNAPAALSLEEDGIDAGAESEETGEEELGAALLTGETVDEATGELEVNVADSVPVRIGTRSVMRAMMKANAPVATSSTNSATNPPYKVQYYAYMERFDYDVKGSVTTLPIINTNKGADPVTGTGKGAGVDGSALPKNGNKESDLNILKLPLMAGEGVTINDNDPKTIGTKAEIKTKTELTQIFKDKGRVFDPSQEFATADKKLDTSFLNGVKAGTETGTNATYEDHYNLEEVWFREAGKPWTVYTTYPGDWKADRQKNLPDEEKNGTFEVKQIAVKSGQTAEQALNEALVYTNTARTQVEGDQHKVVIRSDSEIRLVYTQKKSTDTKNAMLFDYDITDGTKKDGAYITSANGINTELGGDPTKPPYKDQKDKGAIAKPVYAFGNANAGVIYGYNTDGTYYLNKANTGTYGDCSFGLVSGINQETLEPVFASGIKSNPIFSSGDVNGKTNYPADITFSRLGDTFTLSSISGTGVSEDDLESFKLVYNETPSWSGKNKKIWSNSFWPMDKVPEANRKDPLFGAPGNTPKLTKAKYSGDNTFPASDDKKDHNSYFGMKFQVEFAIPQDYVGPLEYLFYGDDDMWVFLDDKLVCDIGGVHSSVGEYVNLWDYITDGPGSSGQHTLSVFYTERGASGSSCWMQFTLPNIMETQPDYSAPNNQALRIEKEVVGEAAPNLETQEYTFSLTLTNTTQARSGQIYSSSGELVGEDKEWIVFQPNTATEFKLKHGQYLLIESLAGAEYLVKEVSQPDGCVTTVNGSTTKDENGCVYLTGKVISTGTKVLFTNTFTYRLPETGGGGYWYTLVCALPMAACCLWYKKKSHGEGGEDGA